MDPYPTPLARRQPHRPQFVDDSNDDEPPLRTYQRRGRESDFKMKVDLPTFTGNARMEEVIDWLAEVGQYLECANVPEDKEVAVSLATSLKVVLQLGGNSSKTRLVAKERQQSIPGHECDDL